MSVMLVTSVKLDGKDVGGIQGHYDKHEAIIILTSQHLRFGDVELANKLLWRYQDLVVTQSSLTCSSTEPKLAPFIKSEFNKFITFYLDESVDSLRDIEEAFEEHITDSFNAYVQEEMSVKVLLAQFLAQDDIMDDRAMLRDRLEYWDSPENNETDEEIRHQQNGIKLLIKGCS